MKAPNIQYALSKGWIQFPEPKNKPVRSKAYWREYMINWRRSHPEKVREYNSGRRKPNPIRKPTGIPVSQLNDRHTYHRLYMRIWRQRKTAITN